MYNAQQRLLNDVPISDLPKITKKIIQCYATLNIFTLKDLLLHLPFRYEDRSTIISLAYLKPNQMATVFGKIIDVYFSNHKKPRLMCKIQEGLHILTLQFIHFNGFIRNKLRVGYYVKAYGEVKFNQFNFEMIHPQIDSAPEQSTLTNNNSNLYTPIYSITAGISQFQIKKHIDYALQLLSQQDKSPELLPIEIAQYLPSIEDTVIFLHQLPLNTDLNRIKMGQHRAKKRLIIEELLAYQYSMHQIKTETEKQAQPLFDQKTLRAPFLNALPFKPTNAQIRVAQEIDADLEKNKCMLRLVQGDVGSGKTLVAALAALRALENKKQVALMAPTEILAEQHFLNFKNWFEPLSITVELLTGKKTAKQKKELYLKLQAGEIDLIIGTHALFVEHVQFFDLGLVIIDEQHRFGVGQRLSLWHKGLSNQSLSTQTVAKQNSPHQLIMTATPIPRTLAMSIYADLNLSIIDELPAGRKPIQTTLISNSKRVEVIQKVAAAIREGRQIYWVCTLVEESEMIDAKPAEENYLELSQCLPDVKIGLIHGKLKPQEKDKIMQDFKAKKLQLLIATTVIEVGVDVPNASIMIIENAERLGLSQLHQLRGRVGRGNTDSFCLLMYQSPLSQTAKERLEIMKSTNDGFIIAEKDFDIRGAGEILGTRQIGTIGFKFVDLVRDQALFAKLDPFTKNKANPALKELARFWLEEKKIYMHA